MGKKKSAASLRPGGRRFEVYNEGLCVYLHDEGFADKLRMLIKTKGEEENTFYDNLSLPDFAKKIVAGGMAASYELHQDDEIWVEVIVGAPLTKKELYASRWFPPQRARLNFPSGRLRIDTPNTMPLDPEDHEDPGAIVEVPPGDYVMSLYRVDWDACRRESIKHKGPGEVIVLTLRKQAKPLGKWSPILPYPEPEVDEGWIGAYKFKEGRGECQVNFWDYWEWVRLNLDRAAAKKIGLEPGSVLRVKAANGSFDLIFIGDMDKAMYLSRFGQAKLEGLIAKRPEVGIGGWQKLGDEIVLSFFRQKSAKAVPEKYHETWIPATFEVLPESFAPPVEEKLPAARRDKHVVRACVAHANDDLLIVNATASDLESFGKTFKLELPHGVHTVAVSEPDRHYLHSVFTGKVVPGGLYILKAMGLRAFMTHSRLAKKLPKDLKDLNPESFPDTERQPLFGLFPSRNQDALSSYLHLHPMYADGNSVMFDWPAPPAVGTAATLRKSS